MDKELKNRVSLYLRYVIIWNFNLSNCKYKWKNFNIRGDSMKKYVIGVDIGGRSMKFGLFTSDGELINKSSIPTHTENDGETILSDLEMHLKKMIEKFELSEENFEGVGIGIPGPILNKSIVKTAVNLGWREPTHVKEYLEPRLNAKVLVENDANVAALGELWKGAGEYVNNLVMITLGTGVGGGIVIDGKIVSGTTGSGGEVGHMPMLENPIQRKCGCGGDRCFELVASATGLEHSATNYLFEHDDSSKLREVDNIDARVIFEYAKEGDKVAEVIVDDYANHLARGLGILSAIVDPEMFVIGGGVSNAGDYLLDKVKASYKDVAFSVTRDVIFKIAELGNDAGMYGAAKLIIS